MSEIRVAIAGEGAIPATEALLSIEGISGNYQRWEEVEKEGVNAAIATIVGIVGESFTIAAQIRQWYLEYKQNKSGKKIARVLILASNGERLLLGNATVEEIQKILNS